jgi:hypothetical protein
LLSAPLLSIHATYVPNRGYDYVGARMRGSILLATTE